MLITALLALGAAGTLPAVPAQTGRSPERVVCRSIVRSGTRVEQRVCLTAREWEIIDEHAMELVREVQRKPIIAR